MFVVLTIVVGFAAAVLSGMFGVGGAVLTTPAIRLVLDASRGVALGTTLPVTIPTTLAGAYTYYRRGLVEVRLVTLAGAGGIAGSVLGASLTSIISLRFLMLLTGALILYVSALTVHRGITGHLVSDESRGYDEDVSTADDDYCTRYDRRFYILCVAVGFAAGFLSGLLGIGGGVVLVPSFVYILRLPLKKAFGTSLAVITIIAIPGTIVHSLIGHVSGWIFLYLTVGAIPGAYLGARISIRLSERLLYIMFGTLLASFGVVFIISEIINSAG